MASLKEKLCSSYRIPRRLLQLTGSFPNENGDYNMKAMVFFNAYMLYVVFLLITEMYTVWPNLIDIAGSIKIMCVALGGFLKFFSYTRNRELIFKLLTTIREDFWDKNLGCVESELRLVEKYANQVYRLTLLLTANILYSGGVRFTKAAVFMYISPDPANPGERILPVNTTVPLIDILADPYYQIIYVAEILGMAYTIVIVAAMDSFVSVFITNVDCQYRIIRERIGNFTNYKMYNTVAKSPEEFLKLCIKRHQELNQLCIDLETVFHLNMLAEYAVVCPFLCLSFFVIMQENLHAYYYIENYNFVIGATLQLFVYCFPADRLTEQALGIADAAYNSDWINASPSTKKLIYIIIMRSQRPIYIKAGKFKPVTVNTFETVIRTAISYFTFLYSVASDE